MARIEKKVWPEYFQLILDGKKQFELRLADCACAPGDTLHLREWDPATKQYTGRALDKAVTRVLRTKEQRFWPQEDADKYGFQIISFD